MFKLIKIIYIFYILKEITAGKVSFKEIVKQIKEHEFNPHEVLIVHYKEEKYTKVQEELLKATFTEIPTKVISIKKSGRIIHEKPPEPFRSSLQTRLCIIILNDRSKDNERNRLLYYLYDHSKKFTHPRYLVLLIRDERGSKSRREMLTLAWRKYHLIHLTIIEVEKKRKLPFTSDNRWNFMIHHYDPYRDKYKFQKYKKGLSIFPNKLNNLHGAKVEAVTLYPPLLKFDEHLTNSNHLNESSPQARIIKFISNLMNFTVTEKFKPNWNLLSQKDLDSIFRHNDVIANELPMSAMYQSFFSCYALHSRRRYYRILVPAQIFGNSQSELKIPFSMGFISSSLLFLVWLILKLFKFDKKISQLLNYIGLLLGNSIDVNLVRLSDRIILISLLMGFWLFSSALHSILTEVKIIAKPKRMLNLEKLNLTVYFSSDFLPLITEKRSNDTIINMFKRTRFIQNDGDCVNFLLDNVPVACLVHENKAISAVTSEFDENRYPRLKILNDFKIDVQTAMHFGENSPYVFEFEKHMKQLEQMGLINKWNQDFARIERSKYKEMNVSTNKNISMSFVLMFTLFIGYGLASLVFAAEILIKRNEEGIWIILFLTLLIKYFLFITILKAMKSFLCADN